MQQPAAYPAFSIPACFLIAERKEEISLSDCAISVDVGSRIALIEQVQEFHNLSDRVQEVTYAFPDGGDGVVMGMTACLDGQEIVLDARSRQDAEQIYEKERKEGNVPVLAGQLGEHVNCIYLGKLAAGARVQVAIRFAAPIKFDEERGRLRIPTTIAPRYGCNRDPERALAMPSPDLLVEHPLRLSVVVREQMHHLQVSCPSHDLKPAESADERQLVFKCSGAYKDRDIVLHFKGRPLGSMGVAVRNPFADGGHVVWLDVAVGKPAENHPMNVHFLIDCSGSMSGFGNRLAASFLSSFAPLFSEQDTFGLSIFGNNPQHLFSCRQGSQIGELESELVGAVRSNLGGTELGHALMSTLEAKHADADIILVTDGHVHEGTELVKRLHNNCRIFVVGVGSSPRAGLLEDIAQATEGSCDFLTACRSSGPAAKSCARLARSGRQRITDISWSDGNKPEWSSPLPQTVHAGIPLPIAAFFPANAPVPPEAVVTVNGKYPLEIAIDRADNREHELSKMAAIRRHNSSSGDEALKIALDYGLMSEMTSMVGVLRPDQRITGASQSTTIRPMLAAGWGGFGSVDRSAAPVKNEARAYEAPRACVRPPVIALLADLNEVSCMAASRSFVTRGMDLVAQYHRRSINPASPPMNIANPPEPILPRRCPLRFLNADTRADRFAAMSKFLEKFCRQISHDKNIAAALFQALENVVCYKLYSKVPAQVFAGQPSNGHGMILQELEAVLNQLISDDLTEKSWRMGWDRFFANFVFDLEDGKLRFALKHQPEDSQLLLLDDRFDILGRNIGPTQN